MEDTDFNACLPQFLYAPSVNNRVGVPGCNNNLPYAAFYYFFGARRLLSIMAAGLEAHVHDSPLGIPACFPECSNLRMLPSETPVPAAGNYFAIFHNNCPDHRIRGNKEPSAFRNFQRLFHAFVARHAHHTTMLPKMPPNKIAATTPARAKGANLGRFL